MQNLGILRQLNDYNLWSNREFLIFLQQFPELSAKAISIFAHLLLAEKTWLKRMRENLDTSNFNFWSGETVEECVALYVENEREFKTFFADLTEDKLETVFNYKNSKGIAFENSWREALMHVFTHSAYHRGQAAISIRTAGVAPPYTDFIQFLRVKMN